jgi:phenylpropionate dioxygenase-like ring-hydroxylating dioxygenase large terminal subunit
MTSLVSSEARRFNAYNTPRDLSEDAELTHVERGTPMGELFRRYWQPVANVRELSDLPLKLKILGEDLVLFKSARGAYGLVEQRCAHRGASLEYGVISEQGIRCAYHGFHYAPDGTILETGAGAPLANGGKICLGAYPTHVFADLVFAYMGPPEKKPAFPMLDLYDAAHIAVESGFEKDCVNECNWLQIHENAMDPVHTAYLHVLTTGAQRGFSDRMGIVPIMQWVQNENGMHYIASRRVKDSDLVWIRVVDTFMPNYGLVPPSDDVQKENISQLPYVATWVVPIDNHNSKRLHVLFNDERNPLKTRVRGFGQANDRSYAERQRHPGDYEVTTGQGPIAIHAYENLTSTDYGVIALRQMIRENIRAVAEGRDPVAVTRDERAKLRIRSQNTFVRAPQAATPEADVALLKSIGREIAEGDQLYRFPPL